MKSVRMWEKQPALPGQGLVEYALILVLVAVVVIVILTQLGPQIGNIFCDVVNGLGGDSLGQCTNITITQADYTPSQQRVKLQATWMGSYDPAITLTASPGGTMGAQGNHYALTIEGVAGCPCTIKVTSSEGDSTSVTVGS